MVVIEHNMDVIKCADHLIDLGPEGGDRGGQVIAEGPPEAVILNPESHTGRFLKKVSERRPAMKKVIVIPARYGSTRLPGKLLLDIAGKPIIQWVYERAMVELTLKDQVLIATDDEGIQKRCAAFGAIRRHDETGLPKRYRPCL